jgi:hypothetical protein
MKTKEEIDELYRKLYSISIDGEDNLHYYSFVDGYTKCQEDMSEEITQLKKSIQKAVDLMCEADEEIANLKEQLLNKQD